MRLEPSDQTPVRPFQVDLRGVVDLLSRHIYSSPQVFLRELLQNGRDAVAARRALDPDAASGRILITPAEAGEPFRFRDDGVGLDAAEAAELLSTVGRSSKRDEVLSMRRDDYLGQFGIGLLSCFMVADHIVIRSRSARGSAPIEWIGDAAGTFTIRELDGEEADGLPVGTEVILHPRADDAALLGRARVTALAVRFGEYLPLDVRVAGAGPDGTAASITRVPPFLEADPDRDDLLAWGREIVGAAPLDSIRIDVPQTGTRGVAFVLPFSPPPGARQASRVYLGRMLVAEHVDALLPDWAFFVRCVVDTTGLAPTASREHLMDDAALAVTREAIGVTLRQWILEQATREPARLREFLALHELALKAMAVHDDELAAAILPLLTVETSIGRLELAEILGRFGELRYTETLDEFRQIRAVAPDDAPIVNGGYTHDAELLRRLPDLFGTTVTRVTVSEILDDLAPPPLDDRDAVRSLEIRADAALASVRAEVSVRVFAPVELPALSVADPEVLRRIERERAGEVATGLWSSIVGDVGRLLDERRAGRGEAASASRLCLNWANPLVRSLAEVDDDVVIDRTVKLLYVQAQLAGHHPLTAADRALMTTALTDIVQLSVRAEPAAESVAEPASPTSPTRPDEGAPA
ncbi:MAG: HSP90 family protein [Microbacteriaceae bacterium]